ncbi:nucleotidyltransferase family protein [Methanosphaera sp.]|jgi:molybdenum cofactor cytidylyltransferase|uniref:nucleotidyltransferase family protein n=1 Tax=Methanosphaera sp. TaxID=2666342 RepID=UPI002A557B8A|nr:NTP transferase domain-containing protein [Methanobacteriaceae archaeon]
MDAIITAAGKNSRMIDDFKQRNKKPIHKLKLEINNKPILIHTIEKVVNADINNITIALGHHKDEIYSLLKEYDLLDTVNIKINEDVNVGLSKTIENCIKDNLDEYYLFTAADQPTISTETINNMINTLKNAPNPKNTISVLARRKIGKLDSAEGLGMPFCCYGNLLYKYLANEDGNLNPILRKMIKNNVEFYGTPSRNELELKNINHYAEYEYIKEKLEK